MKKIISAAILTLAVLFGTIQPASAATTPSYATRAATAKSIHANCMKPYIAVNRDVRAIKAATRIAAIDVGNKVCTLQAYRYTSKYKDMAAMTKGLVTANRLAHPKAVSALKTQTYPLWNALHKKGFSSTNVNGPGTSGINAWLTAARLVRI